MRDIESEKGPLLMTDADKSSSLDPISAVQRELSILANCIPHRRGSALLRELLPWINKAQDAGVKHNDIFNVLKEKGIVANFGTYKMTLHRVRQRPSRTLEKEVTPKGKEIAPVSNVKLNASHVHFDSSKNGKDNDGRPETFDWPALKEEKLEW